jgi:hypothetical protein
MRRITHKNAAANLPLVCHATAKADFPQIGKVITLYLRKKLHCSGCLQSKK